MRVQCMCVCVYVMYPYAEAPLHALSKFAGSALLATGLT